MRSEGRKIPIRMSRSLETNSEGTFITEYVYLGDEAINIIHKKNEELLKQIQRWEDAHSEMIGEVELRARIAELEAVLEARGM